MTHHRDVPDETVARLRSICLALPEAYEEQRWVGARWVGARWMIRQRTFAHVLMVDAGWPPAYARAAGSDGPLTVMTFRSSGPELEALAAASHPFFKPPWFPNIVGLVLEAESWPPRSDWDEVAELVTESYCVLAPQKLVRLVRATD